MEKPKILKEVIEQGTYFERRLKCEDQLPSVQTILNHDFYKFFYGSDAEKSLDQYVGNLGGDSGPNRHREILDKINNQAIAEAKEFIRLVNQAKEELSQYLERQMYEDFRPQNPFETYLYNAIRPQFKELDSKS